MSVESESTIPGPNPPTTTMRPSTTAAALAPLGSGSVQGVVDDGERHMMARTEPVDRF